MTKQRAVKTMEISSLFLARCQPGMSLGRLFNDVEQELILLLHSQIVVDPSSFSEDTFSMRARRKNPRNSFCGTQG
ncbi:hypothetical protein MXB_1583 [Myxobolus squamalis]|nr:hypothetical protein MXB_1583 [Myxobolus squamalis]